MTARHTVLAGLIASMTAGCSLGAQSPRAEGMFERTLGVQAPVELTVTTSSGDIDVRTGPGNAVHIVGRIRVQGLRVTGLSPEEQVRRLEASPPVEQRGSVIDVGQIREADLRQNVSISYEVTVPAGTRVRARTGSGDQRIADLLGPVEVTTGSGDISTGHVRGRVMASTGSGDIDVSGADDGLEVTTGSGDINATTVTGLVDARTGSGDITVQGIPRAHWTVNTGSGDIVVRLPADAGFGLDARTGSGSIDTRHTLNPGGVFSQRRLQGVVRGGGPNVEVTTASGDISIE